MSNIEHTAIVIATMASVSAVVVTTLASVTVIVIALAVNSAVERSGSGSVCERRVDINSRRSCDGIAEQGSEDEKSKEGSTHFTAG